MFIRRTKTRSAEGGKVYYSYRLVRSERSGERVRQRTLLNLGSDFAVATEHWAVLCSRIEQLLERQGVLVELDCPEEVEREAQRIAMQLVQRGAEVAAGGTDLQTVDVESLELERPRTVGVEHVGLWAMERLGLGRLLEGLGSTAGSGRWRWGRSSGGWRSRGRRGRVGAGCASAAGWGVAGGGLRGHEPDASVPCLGCADGASGGHREAPVRAGDGVVSVWVTR